MKPKVLIVCAPGSNRHQDLAQAFLMAGAEAHMITINHLHTSRMSWSDFHLLALPGGFSYADTLGAGHLWALELNAYFADQLHSFVDSNKPVIGICNGFQALLKSGLLTDKNRATLSFNVQHQFSCRWVHIKAQSKTCLWTKNLSEPIIYCPIAHGEGRFLLADDKGYQHLVSRDQIAFSYLDNPNGSTADIAGLCNAQGNVLGLMPHPENHLFNYQHPRMSRGEHGLSALALFKNGVDFMRQ